MAKRRYNDDDTTLRVFQVTVYESIAGNGVCKNKLHSEIVVAVYGYQARKQLIEKLQNPEFKYRNTIAKFLRNY